MEGRTELLHDHYKDTFSQIRERERQRDKYFFLVISLYALLVFEIQYAASFRGALGPVRVSQSAFDLSALPLPGLLSVSWVLTLAVTLRYCQFVIMAERQYDYLHDLEKKISDELGGDVFYREGRNYLEGMPSFQNWVWIWYILIFPLLAIVATSILYSIEMIFLPYPWINKAVDGTSMAGLLLTLYLYRLHPPSVRFRTFRHMFKTNDQMDN